MPIVIGLDSDVEWSNPLNLSSNAKSGFGLDGTSATETKSSPAASPRDWSDIVDTVIAEAAGEGDEGMAAVASVIKNRAGVRGKSAAEVVREPDQFTGYRKPGDAARQAMQDPEMRRRAEAVVASVFSGERPDTTGGADHYHATSVSPDWASKMPRTTRVGNHLFYNSKPGAARPEAETKALGLTGDEPRRSEAEEPFDALLGREPPPADSSFLLSKLQAGKPSSYIESMKPELQTGLTAMFNEAPDQVKSGLDILSGARSPERQAQIIAENAKKYGLDRKAWLADVAEYGPEEAGRRWRPQFKASGMSKNIGAPGGSRHQHGDAADLGWNGGNFSGAPKEVREWVHANASRYGLSFPMGHEPWHIETAGARGGHSHDEDGGLRPFNAEERRPNSDGSYSTEISTTWQLPDGKWVNVPSLWMGKDGPKQFNADDEAGILGSMQRFEEQNGQKFPRFDSEQEAVAAAKTRSAAGGAGAGGGIVIDENFTSDNPGLMAQAGQLREAGLQRQAQEQAAAEQQRIAARTGTDNQAVAARQQELNADRAGRYQAIDESELPAWQKKWEEENRSSGVMGDTGRILKSGVVGLGQSITSLADTVFRKLPGGEKFLEASDAIDRWALGETFDSKMDTAQDRARASVTPEQQAADAKNWWDTENGWFGPAWRDPRSYLRGVGESAPGTVITMLPGGILARGKYLSMIAAGVEQRVAAAAAAKVATVAGAVSEGLLGGADSTRNVRERIAQIPREQLAQSEAVRILVEGGMAEGDAIKALTEDAASQAFLISGVATGMFGGLGDRALARIIADGVGGGVARRVLAGTTRGAVAEGVFEELPQGVAQTISDNAAIQRVDPSQSLTEGVEEAAAAGVATGGVMGGGMGGVGGAASRRQSAPAGIDADPAAAATQDAPRPSGPLGRAVQHGQQRAEDRAVSTLPDVTTAQPTAASTPADDRPEVGATVRVDAEGLEPILGRIEAYEGDEAIVFDSGTGELYQVPIGNVTKTADSIPAQAAALRQKQAEPPVQDVLPEESSDEALRPLEPRASEITTEIPPAKEQKPVTEMRPTRPQPGGRVIVEGENGDRFPARIETYVEDGTEAVVVTDEGKPYQVPVENLSVSGLTPDQVEQQELERNPPIEREPGDAGPNSRRLGERTVVLPDEKHAHLYDLAREQVIAKKLGGTSQVDMSKVMPAERKRLADEFGVSVEDLASMADDYRYRVERAAKEAKSTLPVKMHSVNERLLKQRQAARSKQEPESVAAKDEAGQWWDVELTAPARKRVLEQAGVKRNERVMWGSLTPNIQKKLVAVRDAERGAGTAEQVSAPAQTFKTAKGSVYQVHADGTTTRDKAARNDPGHEGDSGRKPRTAKTVYVDANAAMLSAAGLSGLGPKGARVAIKDGKATLVTWNKAGNGWGTTDDSRDIPIHAEPAVGRYPLELWDKADDVPGYEAYSRMHAGNPITEMSGAERASDVASTDPAPVAAVDDAAHEAATSPSNALPEPTQAQKEAGNYKVGRIRLGGLDISIENPAGSERKGTSPSGKPWSVKMKSHYGYIRGTVGRDKDHIDIFVKPGTEVLDDSAPIFVVDQRDPARGRFDEHKVMAGYASEDEARAAYLDNYTSGWKGLGAISPTTLGEFKVWLGSGKTTEPFAPKWFGARDKAEAHIAKEKLGATHEVVANGKRFEIREKTKTVKPDAQQKPSQIMRENMREPAAEPETGPRALFRSKEWKAAWNGTSAEKFASPHPDSPVAYQMAKGWRDAKAGLEPQRRPVDGTKYRSDGHNPIDDYLMGYVAAREGKGREIRATNAEAVFGRYLLESVDTPAAWEVEAEKALTRVPDSHPMKRKWAANVANGLKSESDRAGVLRQMQGAAPATTVTPRRDYTTTIISLRQGLESWAETGGNTLIEGKLELAERLQALSEEEWAKVEPFFHRDMEPGVTLEPEKGMAAIDEALSGAAPKPAKRTAASAKPKLPVTANTVFTEDAAEKARALLRRKLSGSTLNSGIDPEILQAGVTLAGYHIEKGARTFVAYAQAMLSDLGEDVRPYLKSWYMGVKYDPRATQFDGMSSAAEVEQLMSPTLPSMKEARAMNLQNWITLGREHWKQHLPNRYRELKQAGMLEPALKEAAEQTYREVSQLEESGFQADEAWQMVRETYLLLPSEGTTQTQPRSETADRMMQAASSGTRTVEIR
ncbi:DarB-like antirestriction [Sinorhizobium phage PBC5]|uniref:DarB-like antirestriction n=1 Tax=Sinorhizobium phage PBC5 TaxID=179237 RepID=UPI001BEB8A5C|nr:DarB-like antirestriction [Sinorhizobium phage PBC5]